MNVDWWNGFVLLLVWWLGIGHSHGRTDKPTGRNSSSLDTSARDTSSLSSWTRDHHLPDNVQVGCRELRAKRYISDGFCTSIKPIKEVVCAGNCLPIRQLPWYSEFVKYWSKDKLKEWQCEEDLVRRRKVRLVCHDKTFRTYKIKVVKSCKCKRTVDEHNRTKRKDRKRKRRKQKRNKKNRKQKQTSTQMNNEAP